MMSPAQCPIHTLLSLHANNTFHPTSAQRLVLANREIARLKEQLAHARQ